MRFMIIVKATKHSEAGVRQSREFVEALSVYSEDLARAGVLLTSGKLLPSSSGLKISYPVAGGKPNVTAGPFTEVNGLTAAFLLLNVKSEEEAIEWAIRMPDPHGHGEGEIELRQLFEDPDLAGDPNKQAMEADLRDHIDMLKKS